MLDEGALAVTIGEDLEHAPEILKYAAAAPGGANPCFGELALMHARPRAANVVARSDGVLWKIDRKTFRSVLMRSSEDSLLRTLRSVQVLTSLTAAQLRRLASVLSEVTFPPEHKIFTQGEPVTDAAFYIVAEGRAVVIKRPSATM